MSIDYNVGDTVTYTAFGGQPRTVIVTTKEADIKNGRPGFDGLWTLNSGTQQRVWGYDDQITSVTPRRAFPCPSCDGNIPNNESPGAYPGALSRRDNATEVCSACGVREALEDFAAAMGEESS